MIASADSPTTVFSYRLDDADWHGILGPDAFERSKAGAFATAVPAGRWGEGSAFAVVAPIAGWSGTALLCALRRQVPFDPVDVVGATSAAHLIAMIASDGHLLAAAERREGEMQERIAMLGDFGASLAYARDASALLARAAADVARRMGAGATSIMLVEGDELRLRAAVGLPTDVALGRGQRVGEGIAGWVAKSGQKVVLSGPVTDDRFRGNDPDARESVVIPLRDGGDVLGVLNVKRPTGPTTFAEREDLLEGIASDLARSLRAMNVIAAGERERAHASGFSDLAVAVARHDPREAARAAADTFGHHAVALRDAGGGVIATYGAEGDEVCLEAAVSASARAEGTGFRVGFAKHGSSYEPEDSALAERAADTLALLGHAATTREQRGALRVLAVEDHPVMRLGVRAMLEREGLTVAGLSGTCGEALAVLADAAPDVVLLDLHLPDARGADAVARIHGIAPHVPIVAFSIDRSPQLVRAVLRAGAKGFVSKDTPASRVVAALHAARAGLVAMGGESVDSISAPEPSPARREPEPTPPADSAAPGGGVPADSGAAHEPLTTRELELLHYMAEGHTNKEIARAMVLAEDTVKKGVQMLIAKLGAADRTHAVVLALRNRLIE